MDEEREDEAQEQLPAPESPPESEPELDLSTEEQEDPVAEVPEHNQEPEDEEAPPADSQVDEPEQMEAAAPATENDAVTDADIEKLIAEIEETLSSSSDALVSEYSADQSSPPTDQSVGLHKNKRRSKHKPDDSGESSNESVRSLTVEEATLPVRVDATPPPMSPKETQTDWQASGVEVINLPLLKEMVAVDSGQKSSRFEEKVLGTGITARFKGPMPTVILPLDKYLLFSYTLQCLKVFKLMCHFFNL